MGCLDILIILGLYLYLREGGAPWQSEEFLPMLAWCWDCNLKKMKVKVDTEVPPEYLELLPILTRCWDCNLKGNEG